MTDTQVYRSTDFGEVRVTLISDDPWFVGKDVARALGYSNTKDALARHVDPEDKISGGEVVIPDSMGRGQRPTFINESGLYSLIFSSKLPAAKKFKRWVTSEVLPGIRKHGRHIANPVSVEPLTGEAPTTRQVLLAKQVLRLAELNEKIDKQAEFLARMEGECAGIRVDLEALLTERTRVAHAHRNLLAGEEALK